MNYSLHVLSKKEFDSNHEFYQKSFDEIFNSNFNHNDYNTDFSIFFETHPINSLVYLKENDKIVSFMFASPHRDYDCYSDTTLDHWGINFILTHKKYAGKGYAKLVLLYGFKDIVSKECRQLDFIPINETSKHLFHLITNPFTVGTITRDSDSIVLTIKFNYRFILTAREENFEELQKLAKSYDGWPDY